MSDAINGRIGEGVEEILSVKKGERIRIQALYIRFNRVLSSCCDRVY